MAGEEGLVVDLSARYKTVSVQTEGGGGAEVGQGADQGDTRRHAVREQRPAQGQASGDHIAALRRS